MLVSKHAAGIYTGRYGTQTALKVNRAPAAQAEVDAFVARQEEWHGALREELGVDGDELWRNYVLLQVFDRLSLWLCKGDPAGHGRMEIMLPDRDDPLVIEPTDDGATLDPFPFVGDELVVEVPVRTVPLEGYASDAALAETIAAATVERRPARLVPA